MNIIISRTDGIGDVVLTIPLAGVIKKYYPNSTIWFLGQTYTQPIIDSCEFIDYFIDWRRLSQLSESGILNEFRKIQADVIIHVFPSKLIAKIAYKSGIPLRIGTSHRLYNWLYCNKLINLSRKSSNLHESQLDLKLLQSLVPKSDFSLDDIPHYLGLTKTGILSNDLTRMLSNRQFNLILHPKSNGSAREWGLENYSKLIEMLPSDKFRIFITGTKEEGKLMNEFLIKNSDKITDLTGKLSLNELIQFINQADGLVAASTGPLHIAGALGKFAIGLFAPMRPIFPQRWAPIGQNASYLVQKQNCDKCKNTKICDCIKNIKPLEVKQKLMMAVA
jgi:ADP-heptose:LPS heptosyltransferase